MSQGFAAQGTVTLTYATLPGGSRVDFRVRTGTLPCTNAAPTVSVSAPAADSLHQAGSPISIAANAQDADGAVAQVEFLANGNVIGTDATAPFSFAWPNATAGTHTLSARASDNAGDRTTSTPVSIVVNAQPTVSITSPASATVVQAPGSATLTASAADADGTVSKVDFYQGGTLIGTDTTSPYSLALSNLAAGTYSFTALASDERGGASTSAAVTLIVNAAPTASLTSPTQNAVFTAPANIPITASVADSDGTISSVEFYYGTTLITTLSAAPYSFTWTGVPQGSYSLTARATDNNGATVTSSAVNITVNSGIAKLHFIHVDHLNTPRLVADATGTTVWRWDQQEPFGVNAADENPSGLGAFDLPLRLPGQYFDKETNLHYKRHPLGDRGHAADPRALPALSLPLPKARRCAARVHVAAAPSRAAQGLVQVAHESPAHPLQPCFRARAAQKAHAASGARALGGRRRAPLEPGEGDDGLGVRDRAILEVLYSTGVRRSELAALAVFDWDRPRGAITVRQGKGGRDRVVPIGDRAAAWLGKYVDEVRPQLAREPDDGSLFITDYGEPFEKNRLGDLVRRYLDYAGVKAPGSCHLLRHACATHMLENGADIRFIQALLGHADLSSTQIYTNVSILKLKEIHAATHPARLERRQDAKSLGTADRRPPDRANALLAALEAEAADDERAHR